MTDSKTVENKRFNFKGYGSTGISYTADSEKTSEGLIGKTLRVDIKGVQTTVTFKTKDDFYKLSKIGRPTIGYIFEGAKNTGEQMIEIN